MSKHHQSSRRKSYGRRQHEVRERHDRHHQPEGFEVEYGETTNVVPSRPVRLPRSARAAPPPHVGRLTGGRLRGRPPTDHHARRTPAHRRGADARPARACAPRSGPDDARATGASSSAPSSIAFLLAFFWLAQVVRESATGYDIGRLQVTRDRLDSKAQDLHSDLSRLGHEPAIRKLAIDAGLGQLGDPLILPAR